MKAIAEAIAPLVKTREDVAASNSQPATILLTHQNREHPIKIKTILVPLDFLRPSTAALDYAVALAKKFSAVIHLVHVSEPVSQHVPA